MKGRVTDTGYSEVVSGNSDKTWFDCEPGCYLEPIFKTKFRECNIFLQRSGVKSWITGCYMVQTNAIILLNIFGDNKFVFKSYNQHAYRRLESSDRLFPHWFQFQRRRHFWFLPRNFSKLLSFPALPPPGTESLRHHINILATAKVRISACGAIC